ncbi:stalk domain-containing protein [Paenibacillus kobensis]|uniref:stalk domain-containing protein n=1 Tax=Paenibacillus kobensis TaxID=59841 RepID=UPI000FD876D9|nr:stalk domain-containing protein [Paenibacillus kobensis]
MSKRILAMITVLCLTMACLSLSLSLSLTAGTAHAAESAQAIEGESVNMKLEVGSPVVTINGSALTIQKPVKVNGTTLVPLSVITKAFGAKLNLENNKKITLTYNSTVVVLTIGSNKVTVNGTVSTLSAEPTIASGVTMVPVRVITQAFGANIALSGNQITITGKKAGGTSKAGIDSDAGFTKVGDSYFKWSMKYPADLSLDYQSNDGSLTVWADGSGNPAVIVEVTEDEETSTSEELRDLIMSYFSDDEIVLEKKSVKAGGATFEKVVTKDRSGWFYEYRAAKNGNYVYVISSGAEAKTREGLSKYQPLLDSFTMSFNSADKKLKDITKVVGGMIAYEDEDYGLKLKLPVEWTQYEGSSTPEFSSDNADLSLAVASVANGETAEQWRKQTREKLESDYVADYLRGISEYSVTINNGTAQVLQYEHSWDMKDWTTQYLVFYVSGDHKYGINFEYDREEDEKADNSNNNGKGLFDTILGTLTIDTKFVDENFSEIGEEAPLDDVFVKRTSKKHGYSIELPKSWNDNSESLEDNMNMFMFEYGDLYLTVTSPGTTAKGYADSIDDYVKEEDQAEHGARVISRKTETVNGISVIRVEYEEPEAYIPSNSIAYMFEKNGKLIVLEVEVYKANDTAAFRARFDKVVQSLTFTS